MNEEYSYRRITTDDVNHLKYISLAAFNQPVKDHYFVNKWKTDYTGSINIGFIAFSKSNEPAAYYGVFPCFVEFNGKKILAAQSGDTMTHPSHGGKGLFTTLAKLTYELATQKGIEFVFGFPNDNSYPGFVKKLNWTHNENMNTYKINVNTIPIAGFFKKFKSVFPVYKQFLNIVFQFFKTSKTFFNNSAHENYVINVIHNDDFFRYKLFQDNYLLQINGTNVWLKTDGWLLVGDIEKSDSLDFIKLIQKIKLIALITGHTKLVFSVSNDTWLDNHLKKSIESEKGGYIGYLNLTSTLPLEKMKFVLADLDTF
jgi:hypothetical protein